MEQTNDDEDQQDLEEGVIELVYDDDDPTIVEDLEPLAATTKKAS